MKWFGMAIPTELSIRIARIYGRLGYKSISANYFELWEKSPCLEAFPKVKSQSFAWRFSHVSLWGRRVLHRVNLLGFTSRRLILKKCSDKKRCLKYHFYDECPFAFNEKRCTLAMKDFVAKCVIDKLPSEERRFEEIEEAIKSGEYDKWKA